MFAPSMTCAQRAISSFRKTAKRSGGRASALKPRWRMRSFLSGRGGGRGGGEGQRAQPARFHMRDRFREVREDQVQLAADQIRHGGRAALVRHMLYGRLV